ncbi:hypothetical protein D3C72_1988900 [compost metagenome]
MLLPSSRSFGAIFFVALNDLWISRPAVLVECHYRAVSNPTALKQAIVVVEAEIGLVAVAAPGIRALIINPAHQQRLAAHHSLTLAQCRVQRQI